MSPPAGRLQGGYSVVVEDLSRSFGDFCAVDRISFQVKDGEIFGFLGANGAGKTTTIRMLCGLILPTSGRGLVEGLDIGKEAEEIRKIIGYMSQKFSLYEDLTVSENLEFFGGLYGLSHAQVTRKVKESATAADLEAFSGRRTREIPLGLKQRLALTCAVMHNPHVLFLDEPTAGVDPISRRDFWALIHELASGGTTVFVTTHYMDEAEYCNRLAVMHKGRIAASGSPKSLKNRYQKGSIEEMFIGLVGRERTADDD
ncbi:ABC transporter ATP-binding protein [bacterium]|nr:ABC transporter ATP-binding protein [bacterium]